MATKKKMLQAAAGNAGGGAGLNVEDVFSTYLYEGTGGALTVNNGIDLSNEGGLVWTKNREDTRNHVLFDTERTNGEDYCLFTNTTDPESENSAFNFVPTSTGYTFNNNDDTNKSGFDFVGWTFRKAPKFFTCLTYTGNGSNQTISHDLGSVPGMIIVKDLDTGGNWRIYHRSLGNTFGMDFSTQAKDDDVYWNDTTPTDAVFTVGPKGDTNTNGNNYVAYLFAHNDGDGGFGPDGDADIIKCGSYTPDGSGNATINLGFEPQWLLIKCSSQGGTYRGWAMFDAMRGVPTGSNTSLIEANLSDAEKQWFPNPRFTSTGFETTSADQADTVNTGGQTYIYMAIRRGTKVPESATEVFDVDAYSGNSTAGRIIPSAFPVDLAIVQSRSAAGDTNAVADRLRGANLLLNTPTTDAELTNNTDSITGFDFMDGIEIGTDTRTNWSSGTYVSWMWKRAPGFFDAVAYTASGNGTTISHNLGVAPELAIFKNRTTAGPDWVVHAPNLGTDGFLLLNTNNAVSTASNWYSATADQITFPTAYSGTATSGDNYIAYLFASLDGISKVGSYTGNGSSQTIDCGFTSGARFVIVRDTTGGNWFVFDTDRGITSSSSEALRLNLTSAESSLSDAISPNSSGFIVEASYFNNSGDTYIFYAIA